VPDARLPFLLSRLDNVPDMKDAEMEEGIETDSLNLENLNPETDID
jgi:hypothetical protein